jgi:hypothetical protein
LVNFKKDLHTGCGMKKFFSLIKFKGKLLAFRLPPQNFLVINFLMPASERVFGAEEWASICNFREN